MQKIVFVIESLGYGGAERVMTEITRYLEKKYEITIITFKKKEQEYELAEGINRVNLEIPNIGMKKLIVGTQKLREELLKINAHICISFDILANILLILAAPRDCHTIISERNAPKQTEISMQSKLLRFLLYRNADYYVFQTIEAARCYSKQIQKKSVIIANPIKENLPQKNYENVNKEIVAVGRLAKQKNYELMLQAFYEFLKVHNEYKLSIYGDGKEKENLLEMCRTFQIEDHVKFYGNCSDVHKRMVNAEIFLMTSNYEGIPNALMEAMAMGFPVVATDCPSGGVRMLITDKVNGLLIKDKDPINIKNALCELAENSIEEKRLGKAAQYVKKDFSIEEIGNKWEKLIQRQEEL